MLLCPSTWRTLLAVALAMFASASPAQTPVPQPFVIQDPQAVQAAEALFQDVQALAKLVTPCVESRQGTATECVCRFQPQLERVRRTATSVQAQYPGWRNQVVNWTDPAGRQSRAISVEAVVRQSSPACPAK